MGPGTLWKDLGQEGDMGMPGRNRGIRSQHLWQLASITCMVLANHQHLWGPILSPAIQGLPPGLSRV